MGLLTYLVIGKLKHFLLRDAILLSQLDYQRQRIRGATGALASLACSLKELRTLPSGRAIPRSAASQSKIKPWSNSPFLFAVAVGSVAVCSLALAQAPSIRKIDPPNWWTNLTPELTLLLTGDNLAVARVQTSTHGVTVLDSKTSANGHYLFIHLRLSAAIPAGDLPLRVTNGGDATTVRLPLLARQDPRGHFEGFSRDDVIYLIMPDRFADGD